MKPNLGKWFAILLISIVGILLILGFLLPFFVKPSALENFLVESVEKNTNYLLKVETPKFSILPSPSFYFSNIKLWDKKRGKMDVPFISATSVKCKLHLIPLMFRQIELSDIKLEGVDLQYPLDGAAGEKNKGHVLHVQDGAFEVDSVSSNHWIKFRARGKWLSEKENLSIRGRIKTNLKQIGLSQTSLDMDATLESLPASSLFQWINVAGIEKVEQGSFKLSSHVEKAVGMSPLSMQTKLELSQFIYHSAQDSNVVSKAADYKLELESLADFDQQILTFKNCSLETPFASLKGKGAIDLKTGKIESFELSSPLITLDNLPNYILPLTQIVPLGLGFSGEGSAEFRFQGNPEQLHLDGRVDLSKALLTYSRYFIKPKSVPLVLTTDELFFKHGKQLDGGFNIELDKARLKGSLVQFDITSGIGELTFVTNMFPLEGWQKYLPTFSEYEFSGNLKLFGNSKGDFEKTKKMIMMYHLAFDNVSARAKDLPALFQRLNGTVDGGPFELETRDFNFDFGETHFDVETKAFLQPSIKFNVRVSSPAVDIRNLVIQLRRLTKALGLPENSIDWTKPESTVAGLVQPGNKAENFHAEFEFEKDKATMKSLVFEIYGGKVGLSSLVDLSKTPNSHHADLDIQNISLARLMQKDLKKTVEGNFFLVVKLDGEGFSDELLKTKLKGDGVFSITNGDFQTFDILGSLGSIAELAGLGQYVSGTTRFSDVNGKFVISNGKVQTDHILIYSTDFDVDAQGAIDFDGTLNFRLNAVLSNQLSRKINSSLSETDRIGPIPMILTGKIDQPSIKTDPALIQDFIGNLLSSKLSNILSKQGWLKKPSHPAAASEAGVPQQIADAQNAQNSQPTQKASKKELVQTGMTLLESLFNNKSSS